jgi:hypothetical protein
LKRLINAIRDFFYETTDYAIILIVVAVIGIILIWRFNILFNFDVSKNPMQSEVQPPQTTIQQSTEDEENNTPSLPAETEAYLVRITIPSGSAASDIAEILLNKNLIDSSSDFISRSIALGLDTKLKSGDFEIESDTPLDEIIKIISKTN